MSLPAFATQTVAVQRPTYLNDHGSQIASWSSPSTHTETGCSVQPAGGSETTINRDSVTTGWVLYAPLTADIQETDRVVVAGTAYDVDGPVRRWTSGVLDHIEANLKAVTG